MTTTTTHGLSIGIERLGDEIMLTFKVTGKLTHRDYEVFVPMMESALAEVKEPKIKALVDMTAFHGWELRAAWDDFKFGFKHGSEFTKIAIIGDQPWEKWASKIGGWFIAGEIKYFEDPDASRIWICEPPA